MIFKGGGPTESCVDWELWRKHFSDHVSHRLVAALIYLSKKGRYPSTLSLKPAHFSKLIWELGSKFDGFIYGPGGSTKIYETKPTPSSSRASKKAD